MNTDELAPIPMGMFHSSGVMRVAKKVNFEATTFGQTNGKVQDCVDKRATWTLRKVKEGKVVTVQKTGHTLPSIGNVSASQAEVVQEETSFMAACYGENKSAAGAAVRRRVWKG